MASEVAPVALFAFNRPLHLQKTLQALAGNPLAERSDVTIFCDGPRSSLDAPSVEETRTVARDWSTSGSFASVTIVERPTNLGLSRSVISGVSQVLEDSETVVVVEDDLVVSRDFLAFMNQGLAMYRADPEVISIHGFTMNVDVELPDTFFLRGADCWGWATWRRGWELFEPDGRVLLERLDGSDRGFDFDFEGRFPYRAMLQDQIDGRVDSWAIRWYASAFLADKLTLYPGRSLVRNIGQEGSGTHSIEVPSHSVQEHPFPLPLERIELRESRVARAAIERALAADRPSLWRSLTGRLRKRA